jgi:NADPH:quinone reductase-like Zn-dependent oxidoreductase
MIRSLGADETIDYRACTPSLAQHLSNNYATHDTQFDLFFDANGLEASSLYAASKDFMKPGGIYLDVAGFGHIEDIRTASTAAYNFFERIIRPSWLGGTPRKSIIIMLRAGKMVRLLDCVRI